jgi:hypothetical protein
MNTPRAEYAIRQEVMQGVVVPHMHCEVLLCSSVVCQYPFSQARINSSMRGSMNTHILFPGCPGIISDKNTFLG